jgi:putative transposase
MCSACVGGVVATVIHIFRVKNMHCDDCATLIDDTLRALPGVHDAYSTLRTRETRVDLNPQQTDPDTVTTAITELGFQMKQPSTVAPNQTSAAIGTQISDSAWRIVKPLLRERTTGQAKRIRDERQLFEGIAYKHRNAVPWRDVPATFGPWQTLYARFVRWRSDGTWAKVIAAAQNKSIAEELAWVEAPSD